jgi:hypothetical protein
MYREYWNRWNNFKLLSFEGEGNGAGGGGSVNDKSDLTKAVEKAIESSTVTDEKVDEKKDDKKEDSSKKEEEEEKEDESSGEGEEDEFTEEHLERAKQLYKALSNPATAKQVVEIMARNAGLIQGEQTEKKVVKTITDVIKDELGEDYKFLGAKLSKLIPDVVERIIEEKTQDIREKQILREKEDVSKEFTAAFETLSNEFEDFNDLHDTMNKLMDVIPVNKKLTATQYFRNLYYVAKGQKGASKKSTIQVDKDRLKKSKENVAARLATEGEVKDTASSGKSGQSMGLRESIEDAMNKLLETKK